MCIWVKEWQKGCFQKKLTVSKKSGRLSVAEEESMLWERESMFSDVP